MTEFRAPLDDILFTLNHVADAGKLDDYDAELSGEVASHFAAFAEGEIAPLNLIGDQQGARLENGRVRMPDGYIECYRAFVEAGWPSLTAPEEFGGQGMDALTLAITSEIYSGANHSLQMVTGLVPGAIRTLINFGTDEQKTRHMPLLADGTYLVTMALTEPAAGSDLSAVRCRAEQDGDVWKITGEKIFISGGDQDMSDKILHLVLARTSPEGIKGLSLFLVTSEKTDGTRNDVTVTRIEEKMGLHASPTCQLAFDGAEAELIGGLGNGLKAMFTMMNHARLDVALQGVAHSTRAYDIAQTYAETRKQGRQADGSPAMLTDHADVTRMLREIDAAGLGGRALAHMAFVALESGENPDLVDFLTPVAKVACTEAATHAASTAMQVLGGYGYLQEYHAEQTWRDARICAIYEGANGIHARVLATRLLPAAAGKAFDAFLEQELAETAALAPVVGAWRDARDVILSQSDASPLAHDFMQLTAQTVQACLWHRMLKVADNHPDPDRIKATAEHALSQIGAFAPAYAGLVRAA